MQVVVKLPSVAECSEVSACYLHKSGYVTTEQGLLYRVLCNRT
jgi:hypothetical protein